MDSWTGITPGGLQPSDGPGSVDATNLVNHWGDDSLAATTTTLTLNKTNFVHGIAVNITAGVNPSSATGNVAIEDNYATQQQASTSTTPTLLGLNGGTASGPYALFPAEPITCMPDMVEMVATPAACLSRCS